jgi:5-methylcytosine-specific restriction endonuclease McrA
VTVSFKLPSVIRLLRFVKIKRRIDYVPFSRANIYARDNHTCQYCAEIFPTSELTFDHVTPVAQGGRKDWENIVTCCVTCNRKKGGRTPGEAGMRLLRPAKRPHSAPAVRITIGLREAPESWRDYLYWNVELDDT